MVKLVAFKPSGMGPIVEVTRAELSMLQPYLVNAGDPAETFVLHFAIDGGIKIKINEGTWSPPFGEIMPRET